MFPLLAVSALILMGANLELIFRRLQKGCKLRIILLNPESPSVETWTKAVGGKNTKSEIEKVLDDIGELMKKLDSSGGLEVKLSDT